MPEVKGPASLLLEERTGRLRPRAVWRMLLQYLGFRVLIALLVNLLAVASLLLLSGGRAFSSGAVDTSLLSDSPLVPLISAAASLSAALLSVWLAGRLLDRRPFADFGFHINVRWWLDLLFGLLLGATLMTVIFLTELALGWISITATFESVYAGTPFAQAVLVPVVVFTGVGVYEELIFRGYQLRNAAEGLNYPMLGAKNAVLLAWALSSIFFGWLHSGNPNFPAIGLLNITVAGLMLGLGYVLTGELAIPIGLHITWNFFQGAVYGFPVSGLDTIGASFLTVKQSGPVLLTGGAFGPEAGLIGLSAMALGGLLIVLWIKLRHGGVELHTPLAEPSESGRPSAPGPE
ncbi:MAG TPA: CPBP family intramembrane glutamic endopeptidase [Rubrobacteraceae bacterium]|nr:CPBP family intramembrane glutamic endopeptidase [Rubrobacteraceae bacterium]